MDNVVEMRKFHSVQQLLEHAMTADLDHVVISGITHDGENYFKASGCSTLKEVVWMVFCANDSAQRMIRS